MRPPTGQSLRAAAPSLSLALVVVLMMGGLGFTWLSGERSVTLVLDGREVPTRTHAATVGDLLDRAGVALEQGDAVTPPVDATVVDGMVVHLDRGAGLAHAPAQTAARPVVTRPTRSARVEPDDASAPSAGSHVLRTEVRTETLSHGTVEVFTDALPDGERREAQPGSDGVREVVLAIVEADGEEVAREVIVDRVLTAAVDRVVEVGTAVEPVPEATPEPPPAPDPEPQTTSAPPEPEPAPEPAAEPAPVSADEPAPPANVQEGGASWYDNPYGGMTAAHRTLPRGTIVTVTNLANGKQVQVRINDRGPYVQGRIIDLNREAFAQLASPSRGVVQVRIEW